MARRVPGTVSKHPHFSSVADPLGNAENKVETRHSPYRTRNPRMCQNLTVDPHSTKMTHPEVINQIRRSMHSIYKSDRRRGLELLIPFVKTKNASYNSIT